MTHPAQSRNSVNRLTADGRAELMLALLRIRPQGACHAETPQLCQQHGAHVVSFQRRRKLVVVGQETRCNEIPRASG